jgi:hypothetical protein
MYKTISNEIIRKFNPCYDPSKYIKDENEELTVKEWVQKYRNVVPDKDIIWLLSRKEFMSEKDLRLFVVWCAREALKLVENPDERSVEACNVAERYINGEATKKDLLAVRVAAYDAIDIGNYTVDNATFYVARDVAYAAYTAALYSVYTSYVVAHAAYVAASAAADAAYTAAFYTVYDSYVAADAARDAHTAAFAAQLDKLLTYFE